MPDIYATIADADPEVQARLAEAMEVRAAERRQREMAEAYLGHLDLDGREVIDIGCGTGPIIRLIVERWRPKRLLGVDPSPVFLGRARDLTAGLDVVEVREGDARALDLVDESFDVAILHTVLCHIPEPERALDEARRILRPGGTLALFDGDYSSTSAALGDDDPLQCCVDAAVAALVHDRWLGRRLPDLAKAAGFAVEHHDGHAYVQAAEPTYLLTIVDRGADFMAADGRIGTDLADALKVEARRRVGARRFFGSITFTSVIARKPA